MRPWSPARRGRDPRTKRTQTRSPQPARQPGPPRPAASTVASKRAGPIMWAVAWAVACGERRRRRQQWNQPRQPAAAPARPRGGQREQHPVPRPDTGPPGQLTWPSGAAGTPAQRPRTPPGRPARPRSRRRTVHPARRSRREHGGGPGQARFPRPRTPSGVLGRPQRRPDGAPPLGACLLPATGPALRSRDPVR